MYIIRADGNAKIGAGHLMRCLTVAEALAEKLGGKPDVCFVCADEQSADLAKTAGFQAKVLDTDYQDMESELPLWEQWLTCDMCQSDSMLGVEPEHIILVDSYYVTDDYLRKLRRYGKVYLMDDMQEHTYPVDAVINYNAFADEGAYRQLYAESLDGAKTECFIGSEYVPVRRQFLDRGYRVRDFVTNVLITTGGGDQDNIAGKLLQIIYRNDMDFHVVTGRYNPHLEELREMEKTCEGVHIYHDVSDMASLMQKCDMAVTAGGTTIYELAAIGIPFLCFSYARNQEALTEYIGAKEIAGFLGAYHRNQEDVLKNLQMLFAEYCEKKDLREACCEKERKMIDGRGASHLAEKMYQG